MAKLAQRIYNLLDELKNMPGDQTYLLVTHGGIARCIHSYFFDMTNEEYASYAISQFTDFLTELNSLYEMISSDSTYDKFSTWDCSIDKKKEYLGFFKDVDKDKVLSFAHKQKELFVRWRNYDVLEEVQHINNTEVY